MGFGIREEGEGEGGRVMDGREGEGRISYGSRRMNGLICSRVVLLRLRCCHRLGRAVSLGDGNFTRWERRSASVAASFLVAFRDLLHSCRLFHSSFSFS